MFNECEVWKNSSITKNSYNRKNEGVHAQMGGPI
jgi:hypothetical protein